MSLKVVNKGRVPKLRFPEFLGIWMKNTFGKAATFINGRAYKQEELLSVGKYRVLRVGNFFSNKEWYYSNIELEEKKYCDNGDLLYAWSASFGPRIWRGEKVIYHYHIWKVIENKGVRRDFLFILLDYETERMKATSANGLGLLHITKRDIEAWACYIPTPKEQQKIADCLSSLDDLITTHTQKHTVLKTHKKGLMQQLFPAKGQSVPEVRFIEFLGEWYIKKLGQCFKNVGGTALEKHVKKDGRHHFISIGNYSTDGKYIDKGQRVEANNITTTKLLNKNDLVMVLNDKTAVGDIIGSTLLIDADDKYIYNQRSERLIIDSQLIPIFSWYLLNSQVVRKSIFNISQGGTQIYVNFPSVKAIALTIPGTEQEQQKIADCLTSLDSLITAQAEKIEQLKIHKKGLMQQLFPAMDQAD